MLQSGAILLQSEAVVTKWGKNYYKVRQLLQSGAVVTKWGITSFNISHVHATTHAMLDRLSSIILTQFREYKRPSQPYGKHIQLCGINPSFDSVVKILHSTCKSIPDIGSSIAERSEATDQYQRCILKT